MHSNHVTCSTGSDSPTTLSPNVLPGAFTDEIHRNDRGRCDRFFQARDYFRKRLLKCGSCKGHGRVARRQRVSRLCSGGQFIIVCVLKCCVIRDPCQQWLRPIRAQNESHGIREHHPRVDAYARIYDGHVLNIAGASGARYSLLPPENATGNYVKVVQRIPVKILFEGGQDPQHLLRPGMSVEPNVKVK